MIRLFFVAVQFSTIVPLIVAFHTPDVSRWPRSLLFSQKNTVSPEHSRRDVLMAGLLVSLAPLPVQAGEVGARITKAVTTSDLGVSVRRSVVRGAQIMDQMDGQWEELSDRFGLGAQRNQQQQRPKPKQIPPLQPLDSGLAQTIIDTVDAVFVAVSGIPEKKLKKQVATMGALVLPSFQRSGASVLDLATINTAEEFNFQSYAHFKAFADLLVSNNVNFPTFKKKFERQVGERLLGLLYPDYVSIPPSESRKVKIQQSFAAMDRLARIFIQKGFLAASDRSPIDDETISDWVDDLTDLSFSVALDGDATLSAQILLQEQGYRLIPSYMRFAAAVILDQDGQQATLDEYYMDTDYNSNPDLFDVKEVLLNIVLEST